MKKLFLLLLVLAVCAAAHAGVRTELRKGGKLYEEKKYGQALNQYKQILQDIPDNQAAQFGAGASAYYLKDYASAEKSFEAASQAEGTLAQDALFNLGNAYYRADEQEKAASAYRQAILKNPKDKDAVHNLQLIINEQQNQQNQNNQNKQNQNDNSSNSKNQDGQGQAPQQKPQSAEETQNQMKQDDAQRVMQMARENEYKKPTQSGPAQDDSVEKDW